MSGKDLVKRLKLNGWYLIRIKGSHYIMGKEGFRPLSVPVHGNRSLPPGTLNSLLKQSGLKEQK
jgi:predicted RNA binding protein YcfA (HicA-like mRNA interferase family)